MTRLNGELRDRLELRSAELTLGTADLAIKEAEGLDALRSQHLLAEERLRATLRDLQASHAARLAELAAGFAEQRRIQEDMFRQRSKKLRAEARRARSNREQAPAAKLPLESFVAQHLLETFAAPEPSRQQQQRAEQPLVCSGAAAKLGPGQQPDSSRAPAKQSCVAEHRPEAPCRDDSHKSSLHFAARLQALEERLRRGGRPPNSPEVPLEHLPQADLRPLAMPVCAAPQPKRLPHSRAGSSDRDAALDRSGSRPDLQGPKQSASQPRPQSHRDSKQAWTAGRGPRATPETCLGSQQARDIRLDVPGGEAQEAWADRLSGSRARGREGEARGRRLDFWSVERSREAVDSASSTELDLDGFEWALAARAGSGASSPYSGVAGEIAAMIERVAAGR